MRKSSVSLAALLALVPLGDGLVHAAPAHAVFFENARLWLNGIFLSTGNAAAALGVDMTVNVLRAVLLVWIALGIVRTIQAARKDAEFKLLPQAVSAQIGLLSTTGRCGLPLGPIRLHQLHPRSLGKMPPE